MKWLLRHGIPIFTVWKYLVGGIYQRGDLKLKSVKISVQGPFNANNTAYNSDINMEKPFPK